MYTGDELLWLFLVYSFLGWLLETSMAAVRQKTLVNRGLVNLPFCIIYGISAVCISVFCMELEGFWLFLGAVILSTLIEWISGHLIERFYHERWWDYSHLRFHIDGYISLRSSIIWGVLAFCGMRWGNNFFLYCFRQMPRMVAFGILWNLWILLTIDILATLIVTLDKGKNQERWKNVDAWFSKYTFRMAHWIYAHINRRIERAYHPQERNVAIFREKSAMFAYGCSFHKMVWLFVIGAFLGDVTETIYCRITAGVWMSRSSVVWGPFSIVWGLAIVAATLLLYQYRDRSDTFLFLTGTFLGGAYEYGCSLFSEIVFGKVFWDYSEIPFNLSGRINLLYCFFWGIAAVVWMKLLYPICSAWIEKIPMQVGKALSYALLIFMCCNIVISGLALIRSTQRLNGETADYKWQQIMDERFGDERLKKIYPNMINLE